MKLDKKSSNQPVAIDLFAGAGGLSSGFVKAGFHIAASMEKTAIFNKTHALNFPKSQSICADVSQFKPENFEYLTNLKPGQVDIIIGGPPCQTFSTIGTPKLNSLKGKNVLTDPRNYLFQSYLDYVKHYSPRIFVMENVPALQTKYEGSLFNRILEEIDALGYQVDFKVLNAAEFGVPQSRKRLFIVATKFNLKIDFPTPTHELNDNLQNGYSDEKIKAATVSDAITDLPAIDDGCRHDELPYSKNTNLSFYQKKVRNKSNNVRNNICRMSNERAKKVFAHMKPGDRYMDLPKEVRSILPFREDIFKDRLKRLDPTKPSWTVLAHIGMDGYMYIHPTEDRTLSVREAARLQSFDDSFIFTGNMREQYVQVGNAVPTILAEALAHSVMKAF